MAKSPFLAEELKGPVYLIQQTGTSLPGLLLDLKGRVHVKIQTKTTLINNKRIQSLVLNAPQLPVSELRVALNGGRTTGVFLNRAGPLLQGQLDLEVQQRRLAGQVLRPQRQEHVRRDGQGEGQRLRAGRHRQHHRRDEHPAERARQGAEAPGLARTSRS